MTVLSRVFLHMKTVKCGNIYIYTYFSAKNKLNLQSDKKNFKVEINYVVTKRIIVLDILSY
jgi:hypothetical protein